MKILKVEVDKEPVIKEIDKNIESMQKEVGGFIEVLSIKNNLCVVFNEEGKLMNLPPNKIIIIDGIETDCIVGDFFICGVNSEDFCSIPDNMIEEAKNIIVD